VNKITPHWVKGALIAPLSAGLIFMTIGGVLALFSELPKPITVEPDALAEYVMAMVPAIAVGWIIAIIPCCIGASALAYWGGSNPAARSMALWIITGAAVTITPSLIALGISDEGASVAVVFGTCGTVCAAICRRFTTWQVIDPQPTRQRPARAVNPGRLLE
jgi:ABC-type dipeptide/oligopeptide/nickel transport system permease subunit